MTLYVFAMGAITGGAAAWCVGFLNRLRDARRGGRREHELPNGGLIITSRALSASESARLVDEWTAKHDFPTET